MEHGGNIYSNKVSLDFSVNINPLGTSDSIKEAFLKGVSELGNYPDPHCSSLREALSKRLGVEGEKIIFSNGASELFMAIMHAINPGRVLLCAPSFLGYKWVCDAIGCQVTTFKTSQENGFVPGMDLLDAIEDVDLVFITSPNNPTGAYIPREVLLPLAEKCQQNNIYLVLDECFMTLSDSPEENTLIGEIDDLSKMILVRAFTKSFAIPGIRLGFGICSDRELVKNIGRQLPEWSISVPAQACGLAALSDWGFIDRGREIIIKNRPMLYDILKGYGKTFHSDVNFVLVKSDYPLYERLLERGILIRDCSNYEGLGRGYYRLAVRDEGDLLILSDTLKNISW